MYDVRVRKVNVLPKHLKFICINEGLDGDDLVIVRTTMEKVEGNPIEYLQTHLK